MKEKREGVNFENILYRYTRSIAQVLYLRKCANYPVSFIAVQTEFMVE